MRTSAQRIGDAAEGLVEEHLRAAGWSILGRQVRVGRQELDLVAIDPGPPGRLVAVEVRARGRRDFGHPEDTVDHRKRARLRLAATELAARGHLGDGSRLPAMRVAVDLIVVEPSVDAGGRPRLRHHRDVLA
jgi:putative endonuclease